MTNRYGSDVSMSGWGSSTPTHRLCEGRTYAIFKQVTHFSGSYGFISKLEKYVLKQFNDRRLRHSVIYNADNVAVSDNTLRSEIVFAPLQHILTAVMDFYQERQEDMSAKEIETMQAITATARCYKRCFTIKDVVDVLNVFRQQKGRKPIRDININKGDINVVIDKTIRDYDINSFEQFIVNSCDCRGVVDYKTAYTNTSIADNRFLLFLDSKRCEDLKFGIPVDERWSEISTKEILIELMKTLMKY